jgi:hypothetical protein
MILHKTYKGILRRTGVGSQRETATKYAVLQIDKKIITNVLISDKLDSYLDAGSYVELTVVRMPMTFIKVVVVLKNDEITLRDNGITHYAIWAIFATVFFLCISSFRSEIIFSYLLGNTGMPKGQEKLLWFTLVLGFLLVFELFNLLSALKGKKPD